jgi:hypothetical protein
MAGFEVWPQSAHDESTILPLSLKENRIRVRVHAQGNGFEEVFCIA